MSDPRAKAEKSKYKDFKQAPARDREVDYHKKRKKKKDYKYEVIKKYTNPKFSFMSNIFNKKFETLELAERYKAKLIRESSHGIMKRIEIEVTIEEIKND